MEITKEDYDNTEKGEVMAATLVVDGPEGINVSNPGNFLKLIVVKGYGDDWTAYIENHYEAMGMLDVLRRGDKVFPEQLRKVIDIDEELFEKFRY
ncbi:MAG: hypothetical protein ACOCRX_09465 [Candidatus Woesearchaeota archaeon]